VKVASGLGDFPSCHDTFSGPVILYQRPTFPPSYPIRISERLLKLFLPFGTGERFWGWFLDPAHGAALVTRDVRKLEPFLTLLAVHGEVARDPGPDN